MKFLLAFTIQAALLALVFGIGNQRQFRNSKMNINGDRVEILSDSNDVSFLVFGDWGGLPVFPYRTIVEQAVSNELTVWAQKHNTQFQMALGDNFYFNGVADVNDKRFNSTFEDVFTSDELVNTPWLMLMGNHDHYGNASAQLDYTKKSKRWIMPTYNYTVDVLMPDKQPLFKILMLDTVLLCGNSGFDWEAPRQPMLRTRLERRRAADGWAAIETELAAIDADSTYTPYVLVAGHFPVWSIAEHGPTKCLVDNLRPLLHKYNVTAYLSGHDHNLQYLTDTYLGTDVSFILSGASNFNDNSSVHIKDVPISSLKFHWADPLFTINGGFCLFEATRDNLTVTYVETNGRELYQTVIQPRKPKQH